MILLQSPYRLSIFKKNHCTVFTFERDTKVQEGKILIKIFKKNHCTVFTFERDTTVIEGKSIARVQGNRRRIVSYSMCV